MSTPLVTVGVASFNNARFLTETLDSIRAQDYPNWELIIVDDNSRDDSAQVARQWLAAHPDVRGQLLINNPNRGVCHTFNRSIQAGRGTYYSLIGSDDLYLPDKLSRQVAALEALPPDYALVYSDITNIDEQGRPLFGGAPVLGNRPRPEGEVYTEMLRGNFIPAMGQLMRMSLFEVVGLFDEKLAYEDWDMWLRLTKRFKVKYVPGEVARYRLHPGGASVARRQQINEANLELLDKHTGQSVELDGILAGHFANFATALAWLDSPKATYWLRRALALRPNPRTAALLALTASGLTLPRLHRWYRKLRPVEKAQH